MSKELNDGLTEALCDLAWDEGYAKGQMALADVLEDMVDEFSGCGGCLVEYEELELRKLIESVRKTYGGDK